MSSGDEFGSYDITTPYKPVSKTVTRAPALKPAVAGPSKSTSTTTTAKRKNAQPPRETDVEEIIPDEPIHVSSDEEDVDAAPAVPQGKGKGKKVESGVDTTALNGKSSSKGKGKSKVKTIARKNPSVADLMDVEEVQETEGEQPSRRAGRITRNGTGKGKDKVDPGHRMKDYDAMAAELDRVRKQLQDVTDQRDSFSRQTEELFSIRHTEIEQSLEHHKAQYEARIRTQEEMIQELTTQLARVDSMTRAGKTSTLHFLTREAADEEKRSLEREIARLNRSLKEGQENADQERKKSAELEQIVANLRSELKLEIERSKQLASRNPPSSVSRPGLQLPISHKNGDVVRFYEDMTNFLVVGYKTLPVKHFDLQEALCQCIYTTEGSDPPHSLAFTLYIHWDRKDSRSDKPITSKDELVEAVTYTPDFDQQSDMAFVERLDFLANSFTFNRSQLRIFFQNTLVKKMNEAEFGEYEAMEEGV